MARGKAPLLSRKHGAPNAFRAHALLTGKRFYMDPDNKCAIHGDTLRRTNSNECITCERLREGRRPKRKREYNKPSAEYLRLRSQVEAREQFRAGLLDDLLEALGAGSVLEAYRQHVLALADILVDRRVAQVLLALYPEARPDHADPFGCNN